MTLLDTPPKLKRPAEVLSGAEVNRLIAACPSDEPIGLRNRALVATFYRCGLRCDEALSLMPKDLDRPNGCVRVLHGKGDKARTVGMDPGAFAILAEWMQARSLLPAVTDASPVFCTMKGGRMFSAYVRVLLPRLARIAGIMKRVHPHGLRHTHAAELAREGVSIVEISAQLGHSNIAVTDRYVRHLAPQQVIQTMQRRTWTPNPLSDRSIKTND